MVHALPKNYYASNQEEGFIEFYIPTFYAGGYLQFHRVAIKVVEVLDHKILREEIIKLKRTHLENNNPKKGQLLRADSETLIVVAPHLSEEARAVRREWKDKIQQEPKAENTWFLRGRRTYAGYGEMVILASEPERVLKRILIGLAKFYEARLKALLREFNLEYLTQNAFNWHRIESIYYMQSIHIIDDCSYTLGQAVRCFSHNIYWFRLQIRRIFAEIGYQNTILKARREISALEPSIREIGSIQVLKSRRGRRIFLNMFNSNSKTKRTLEILKTYDRLKSLLNEDPCKEAPFPIRIPYPLGPRNPSLPTLSASKQGRP